VEETSIFGNRVHIMVNENYKNEDQIKNYLNQNSIEVGRINRIVPSLEDVFIHLLETHSKNKT
jgi:ABC-2 type transport system ATP-binding protein